MSRNFDRAVEIKNRIDFYEDQAAANDDDLEMALFAAIIDALDAEEDDEELDEEEEVTLTSAYDMDSEFNEFSTPADDEHSYAYVDAYGPYTSHVTRLRQAAENGGVRFNTGETLDEVFGPCGAD